MNADARASLERFRKAVARRLGLHFDDAKLGFLAEVLQRRAEATGQDAGEYACQMETAISQAERRSLAEELTVCETYFFRNFDQFRAFTEVSLPEALAGKSRPVRILSAGCASGEEAYSIAMLARDATRAREADLSIRAVDINAAMLEKASRARYSPWSLRETPSDAQRRWFVAHGRELALDPSIRNAVRFEERNLAHEDPELWRPGSYEVIFCRNVLMYFTPAVAVAVVDRMARALVPGGYLFLGHAETLRGLSSSFHLCHTHNTFYYQRRDVIERQRTPDELSAVPMAAGVGWTSCWIETVQRTTDRIRALDERPLSPDEAQPHRASEIGTAARLSGAIDLLQKERFAEALALIRELPQESSRDPDVLLLRAGLLTHSGQLSRAETVCSELLEIDELNAGAHYLLALCREGAGDRSGAIEHDQVASYLDPAFAMPRLHLGLIARRAGDLVTAGRELGQAVMLLEREDPSRLLLFGGGFSRDALIALCRAELGGVGAEL
jgi:chemotaxis protein methyltransferase CheR